MEGKGDYMRCRQGQKINQTATAKNQGLAERANATDSRLKKQSGKNVRKADALISSKMNQSCYA